MISPPSGSPARKRGKIVAKSALAVEIVGAGKGRIGGDAEPRAPCGESPGSAYRAASPCGRAAAAPNAARPHCRTQALGRHLGDHLEQGVAHLRQQMHVLMAVDEVGRSAERVDEGVHLRGDLDRQQFAVAAGASSPRASSCLSGRKRPSRSGAKPSLIGLNGAVSVTCRPSAARFSPELSLSSASASLGVEDAAPPSSPRWR